MNPKTERILWWGIIGVAGYWLYKNSDAVAGAADLASSAVTAAVLGWKSAGSGPTWVPVCNQIEAQYELPADILAATAYQECDFIEAYIRGTRPSSDGLSLGIMQLQTRYYPSLVGPGVPVPYTDQNVTDQIDMAGQVFASNYASLQSWPATIAAWNQGLAGVQSNGITSTQYVANVLGNAPAANV
jgi:hypothetical protein